MCAALLTAAAAPVARQPTDSPRVLLLPGNMRPALTRMIGDLQGPVSPRYHHWLSAAQLAGYGPAPAVVERTFHTGLHRLDVAGVADMANMGDPSIPAALSGVVAGVVSSNDFRPQPAVETR